MRPPKLGKGGEFFVDDTASLNSIFCPSHSSKMSCSSSGVILCPSDSFEYSFSDQLEWCFIVKLLHILVVELQIDRHHVQTRIAEHLLQPSYVSSVSHAVDRI